MTETNSHDTVVIELIDTMEPRQKPRPLTELEKQKLREARRKFGYPDTPPAEPKNDGGQ